MILTRRTLMTLATGGFVTAMSPVASLSKAAGPLLEVTRSPSCGCCSAWIDHVRRAGFAVRETVVEDLAPMKARLGVPSDLQSCHTATIDGFVIEGHVPSADIQRLLRERPAAMGLAVPGMPAGSPGMEVAGHAEAYEVVLFGPEGREVFARY